MYFLLFNYRVFKELWVIIGLIFCDIDWLTICLNQSDDRKTKPVMIRFHFKNATKKTRSKDVNTKPEYSTIKNLKHVTQNDLTKIKFNINFRYATSPCKASLYKSRAVISNCISEKYCQVWTILNEESSKQSGITAL